DAQLFDLPERADLRDHPRGREAVQLVADYTGEHERAVLEDLRLRFFVRHTWPQSKTPPPRPRGGKGACPIAWNCDLPKLQLRLPEVPRQESRRQYASPESSRPSRSGYSGSSGCGRIAGPAVP